MRSLALACLLAASTVTAQPWTDGDRLVDDDASVTCRAEHAARKQPAPPEAWTPPTCLHLARLRADRIELLAPVYFATGKYTLQRSSFALLDDVAAILLAHPALYVEVQGHYRDPGYSMKLSDRRAHAVLEYLVRRGVDPRQLYANGYGEDVPLVRASDKDATRINWRIELRLHERPAPP